MDKKKLQIVIHCDTLELFKYKNGGEAGIRTLVTLRVNSISSAAQSTTLSPLRLIGTEGLDT